MPQPLSKFIKPGVPWAMAIDAAEIPKKPALAVLIAETVAKASAMEHGMAMILVHLLHASPEPAFAMFSEVMDAGNKRSMILAAARAALPAEDFEAFEAISSAYRTQMDVRNKFAHWLWGSCDQVDDALVLVDPRYMLKHRRNHQQVWNSDEDFGVAETERHELRMAAMSYDFDKIYVYRKADFDNVLRDLDETIQMINLIGFILDPFVANLDERLRGAFPDRESGASTARQTLSSLRLFSEALTRLRNNRQKS
jgi:hypothetical protein